MSLSLCTHLDASRCAKRSYYAILIHWETRIHTLARRGVNIRLEPSRDWCHWTRHQSPCVGRRLALARALGVARVYQGPLVIVLGCGWMEVARLQLPPVVEEFESRGVVFHGLGVGCSVVLNGLGLRRGFAFNGSGGIGLPGEPVVRSSWFRTGHFAALGRPRHFSFGPILATFRIQDRFIRIRMGIQIASEFVASGKWTAPYPDKWAPPLSPKGAPAPCISVLRPPS